MATARKIEPAEWNAHKLEIEALFLKQNKTVEQLRQSMKDTHGFLASTAQYIRKLKQWGFEKNTTSDNWKYIAHQVQKRKMEGKESNAFINGKLVSHKKIKREISRYDLPTYAKRPLESSPDPPDGIMVRTPSCDTVSVVEYQHIPWLEFQILFEPFCKDILKASSSQILADEGPYLDSHDRTPATILTQQTSHNGYSSILQNKGLQPLGRASLFRSNRQPRLEAQTYQAQYINPIALHNSSVGYGTPVLLTSHRSSQEAYRLLADCLDIEIESESADFNSQISDCLDSTMVEAHCDDLQTNASKLCQMSTKDASVELVRFAIYLSSNNLLSNAQTDKFLKWTLNNGAFWILQGLLMLKVPTVELLASSLLLSAIRQDESSIARTILTTGVDVNAGAGEYLPERALLLAIDKPVQKQDIKLIEQLLDSGADPNAEVMFLGGSALSSAIHRGSSIELVKRLVEAGANPDSALYNGYVLIKLLDQAVAKNDFQLLRMLLDKKASEMNSTTIRDNMLKKISSSDAIGLIQAVFELGRAPTESDCSTEYGTGKQGFDLDHLFEVLVENCENSKLDMLFVEARGAYCDDCFGFPISEDMHYLPQDPLLLAPALHRAIESDQIIHARVLLCAGAQPNDPGPVYDTALEVAVEKGHTRLAKILLECGADVDAFFSTDPEMTTLQTAAKKGYIDIIRLLLDAGADVNAPPCGEAGRTALQAAAEKGYTDTVRLLIDAGADVHAPPCQDLGMTALQAAASNGYIDIIRLLLDAGAEVNARGGRFRGQTALQAAVEYNDIDTVTLLLDAGAEIDAPAAEKYGRTTIQAATTSKNIDIIRLLSDVGTKPNAPAGNVHRFMALKAAVDVHRSGAVAIFLNAGANIDATQSEVGGNSALHAASRCKDKDCGLLQKVLLEWSHLFDPAGKQALLEWAVHHGALELVKNLLECGTDPNTPGEGAFNSALFEAVRANNIEIAAELMDSGADPNKSEKSWWCEKPLQLAIERELADMVNLLIARGATIHYSRSYSDPSLKADRISFLNLAISARNASIKIIQALIDSGANVNGEDPDVSTPLQNACKLGKLELVKILLHNGASLNAPPVGCDGFTALQAAVGAQNLQLVRLLLQSGADVNAPAAEKWGATALQRAVIVGHLRITLVLLEAGADINAPGASQYGMTALDAAAEHGRLDILHLLLKNDTEKQTLAARCEQAAKLAIENGRVVIARILRGYV